MPRLSVDIDLTCLPVSDRDTVLTDIRSQLARIAEAISLPDAKVQLVEGDASKSPVDRSDARIKIEPSIVIRGSLLPPGVGLRVKRVSGVIIEMVEEPLKRSLPLDRQFAL